MAAKERERVAQDVGGPGDGPGGLEGQVIGCLVTSIAFPSGFYRSLES